MRLYFRLCLLAFIIFLTNFCSGKEESWKVSCSFGPLELQSIEVTPDVTIFSGKEGEDFLYNYYYIYPTEPWRKNLISSFINGMQFSKHEGQSYGVKVGNSKYCIKFINSEFDTVSIEGFNLPDSTKKFIDKLFLVDSLNLPKKIKGHFEFLTYDCVVPTLPISK